MKQPSATSPQSIMPGYPWMYDARLDPSHVEGKIITLRRLGVPYPDGYERQAEARPDGAGGTDRGRPDERAASTTTADREIVALIAYLQRLGTDIKTRARRRPRDRLGTDGCRRGGGQ